VHPVPDPLIFFFFSVSAGNRTRASGSVANIYKFSSYLTGNTIYLRCVARNSDHQTREAVETAFAVIMVQSFTEKGQFYWYLGSVSTDIQMNTDGAFHVKWSRGILSRCVFVLVPESRGSNIERQGCWYTAQKVKCWQTFGITVWVGYSSQLHASLRVTERCTEFLGVKKIGRLQARLQTSLVTKHFSQLPITTATRMTTNNAEEPYFNSPSFRNRKVHYHIFTLAFILRRNNIIEH
jgi:hypothetical protein